MSNPPYDTKKLEIFLNWLNDSLTDTGTAILLLPSGFIDKERPKALVEVLKKFRCLHREPMTETFAHTAVRAEVVVLVKTF